MSKIKEEVELNYLVEKDSIKIFEKNDFNPEHILECGQIFSYEKTSDGYVVYSMDKQAKLSEKEYGFLIETKNPEYFETFFDLKTDYSSVKKKLSEFEILKKPIVFGYGIRILRQDLFETLISFIVSANNNIKRIQLILNRIRQNFGKNMGTFHAFPTRKQLLKATESDFVEMGAGYRAKYLYKVLRQIDEKTLNDWQALSTVQLRQKLITLAGVGPKVADCILLFGFSRGDVFPVDTWIAKMYRKYYKNQPELTRENIRHNLTQEFGMLSGYAQQYLFYYMRAN